MIHDCLKEQCYKSFQQNPYISVLCLYTSTQIPQSRSIYCYSLVLNIDSVDVEESNEPVAELKSNEDHGDTNPGELETQLQLRMIPRTFVQALSCSNFNLK